MTPARITGQFILAAAAVCVFPSHAGAQLLKRSLVIRNARIVTMDGPTIERGSILIQGDRIVAVGKSVKTPPLATSIDAAGKTVTPGLIDAWSALGHLGGSGSAGATSRAVDALDRYHRDYFREALRNGVTTVYLGPNAGVGIGGTGVVVQLKPEAHGAAGHVLREDAALAINLGSDQGAIGRAKAFQKIRVQFRKALDYRKSLEEYEEDLEEYLEKLEERRKESADEEGEGDEKGSDEDSDEDEESADEEGEQPEKEPTPKPEDDDNGRFSTGSKRSRDRAASVGGLRVTKLADDDDGKPKDDKKPEGDDGKDDAEEDDDEEEELKKPAKPSPDRTSDVLLKAIDRELVVRINAHRTADIYNALELADEFHLKIILEGATDAHLLAERLADADVAVVLGPSVRTHLFENNAHRRHSADAAGALTDAGVSWSIGSGALGSLQARFVGLVAQLACRSIGDRDAWLRAVTTQAADILESSKKIGRIKPGYSADIVIWKGDPGDPAAGVDRVLVAGRVVFNATRKARGGGS